MAPRSSLLGKAERLFRASGTSRTATATSIRSAATLAETSGTTETRQQWVPASKNAVEMIYEWDKVLSTIDPSQFSSNVYTPVTHASDAKADDDDSRDESIAESFRALQRQLLQCELGPEQVCTLFAP